jgi:2Fe-2S ferredoxin
VSGGRVSVRFVARRADGTTQVHEVQAAVGQSAMRAAVGAGLEAIAADCGGLLTCATCHVYVAPEWVARLPGPGTEELGMLEFAAAPRRETSRLSCQIVLDPGLDGLMLELPERQY